MSYYSHTHESPNILIRYAHRRRLKTALGLIKVSSDIRLLDYGCGDGLLLRQLVHRYHCADRFFGFEPFMEPLPGNETKIFKEWESVESHFRGDQRATVVTCFEVL